MQTIGERLRFLRTKKNLSQEEVAHILSIERSTYCNYENNHRTPNIDSIIKLANLFHCSADYILGISDGINRNSLDLNILLTSNKDIYVDGIRINEEEKKMILENSKNMLKPLDLNLLLTSNEDLYVNGVRINKKEKKMILENIKQILKPLDLNLLLTSSKKIYINGVRINEKEKKIILETIKHILKIIY